MMRQYLWVGLASDLRIHPAPSSTHFCDGLIKEEWLLSSAFERNNQNFREGFKKQKIGEGVTGCLNA